MVSQSDPSQWSRPPHPLGGGVRSRVWEIASPLGPRVIKVGPVAPLAHEATTLMQLAGTGLGPALVAAGDGMLVTERCDGDPRSPEAWEIGDARVLGALIARVHQSRTTAWRDLPDGSGRELSHDAYLRARIDQIQSRGVPAQGAVVARVIAHAPAPDHREAVRLHGDLWSANVVWCPRGPVLVDWEYSHQGDRAEELAYLAEMDALSGPLMDAVRDGYGADGGLRACVERWRPLVAVWCGLWFADHGDPERCSGLLLRAERQLG